jgi:hypothetical protein
MCLLAQYTGAARSIREADRMQLTEIIDFLLEFFTSAIFIFALLMIVCVGAFRYSTRSKTSVGVHVVKQMRRMIIDVEKEREITEPAVQSRQEIITKIFGSQMNSIGLEPSSDSGYVPVSYTPLAKFLKDRGVHDDTIGAILDGLKEVETKEDVRNIIDAAADTPGVDLTGEELETAKQLAVNEWNNVRGSKDA